MGGWGGGASHWNSRWTSHWTSHWTSWELLWELSLELSFCVSGIPVLFENQAAPEPPADVRADDPGKFDSTALAEI